MQSIEWSEVRTIVYRPSFLVVPSLLSRYLSSYNVIIIAAGSVFLMLLLKCTFYIIKLFCFLVKMICSAQKRQLPVYGYCVLHHCRIGF